MTPSGIEAATFRFVAQYLNHCATISDPQQKRGHATNVRQSDTSYGLLSLLEELTMFM
jgi:hypothetical protein